MNTDTSITETKRLPVVVNVEGLCELLQLGRPSALKVAVAAGARIDIEGSRILRFNVKKILEYIEENSY